MRGFEQSQSDVGTVRHAVTCVLACFGLGIVRDVLRKSQGCNNHNLIFCAAVGTVRKPGP